jgi:glyoxylase-like metal-dependent hydrolase (beta-lactamase superfamily II)
MKIDTIPLGIDNCDLLEGEQCVFIDGGARVGRTHRRQGLCAHSRACYRRARPYEHACSSSFDRYPVNARRHRKSATTAFRLKPYGVPGAVVYTPGHSPGSVSMVLDSGRPSLAIWP